ncbi:hypothetical protein [Streptomyces huiliensis]|uniref:hypothetical protein n=1 Tax=Streptomyces huiliensis TaxID=2876027 RepID=UPI001CBC0D9A|nr:hypothetical protein [Streptomyces huiliensis]MBZ4322765.1 hypothetical protein [Streptomyces huiliensis]
MFGELVGADAGVLLLGTQSRLQPGTGLLHLFQGVEDILLGGGNRGRRDGQRVAPVAVPAADAKPVGAWAGDREEQPFVHGVNRSDWRDSRGADPSAGVSWSVTLEPGHRLR